MKKISFNNGWKMNGAEVIVPHDAMIHAARSADAPSGSHQGYFHGGKYEYENTFARPEAEHVLFQFEGVYRNAKVYINGHEAGGAAYGYIPFFVCADEYLVDGENNISVTCENADQPDSRWYAGAGIFRPVWLWIGPKEAILPEQVKISTVSINPAVVKVATGHTDAEITILDGDKLLAAGNGAEAEITIPGAQLWSADNPKMYTCKVKTANDKAEVAFGIRSITWDNTGFYVNGQRTLLKGGCIHHDNGILGAAAFDEAEWRRVRILKEQGFNAIRSAHNPTSRALIEACDHYGMYVMDESWDMWFRKKTRHDYSAQWRDNYIADLEAMVERDYNHPSVVMYSIGNEVSEPASEEGLAVTKEMVEYLHSIDNTRPVTGGFNLMIIANASKGKFIFKEEGGTGDSEKKSQGMNSTMFNLMTSIVGTGMNKSANGRKADAATTPGLDALDIAGYNYASGRYAMDGKLHPNRIIIGSETFPQDIARNWEMVEKYPYLIGDFMWTAWDYIGEVGIGAWAYTKDAAGFNKPYPWLLADTGAIDIIGTPNGEAFLARAAWNADEKPLIAVQPVNHPGQKPTKMVWRGTNAIPSWAWQGCEGNKAVVEVYSGAHAVELYLNGKKLGKKKLKGKKASFKVKYAPGRLEAAAYDINGREVSRNFLESATGRTGIILVPEKKSAPAGGVVYVDVNITGANGVVESNADRRLNLTVTGGRLLGFGSANPRTEERFDSGEYTTYYGRALAAVMVEGNTTVTVTDGNETRSITIAAEK